jgi:hypothetical protein
MSLLWPAPFWPAAQNPESPIRDDDESSPGQNTPGRRVRERRRARRYPLKLPLHYRVTENRGGQAGDGETIDISSKAILFGGDSHPPIGSTIEAVMRWPVQVGGEMPLRLVISGPVLRRDDRGAVALIKRFEFFQEIEAGPRPRGTEPPRSAFGGSRTRTAR